MLAALCIREPRRRWVGRRPPAVQSEIVGVGSGKFLKITAVPRRNGIPDWAGIRRAAGREAGRILIPRGYTPPPDSRIAPFRGVALSRRLMALSAVALLETVALNPRLVRIAVYDPQAAMPDLPLSFIPFAADVRVITGRPERYNMQRHVAMQQYGAVLTVAADCSGIDGCLLVLAPNFSPDVYNELKRMAAAHGWILTAVGFGEGSKIDIKGVIHGYFPRVSHSLLAATPPGCDAMQFLAGLYELSSVGEIASMPPEFLQTGGHTITLKDAAWRLAGIDIGISV